MRTVLVETPEAFLTWLDRRRALGQDRFDEMWEGEYHVAPGPTPAHADLDHQIAQLLGPLAGTAGLRGFGPLNIGVKDDYRVPDGAYRRDRSNQIYVPSVAIVVEILSPRDETWDKLDFYFAHDVEEMLVVDPVAREVHWLRRGASGLVAAAGSELLGLTAIELAERLDWPPV